MELLFKKGDYNQFIDMVNTSKELLNDSLLLRSIKEKVDLSISKSVEDQTKQENLTLILLLFIPLTLVLVYLNAIHGISWRLVPLLGVIGYVIFYRTSINTPNLNNQLFPEEDHTENLKPMKYLEMKIKYLMSFYDYLKLSHDLVRWFYIIFFPFLCLFLYELVFGVTPFGHVLLGLLGALLIGGVFWYFYFKRNVDRAHFNKEKLKRYISHITEISSTNSE